MSDLIPIKNLDKEHLLKNSDVFCMYPWVHVYKSPTDMVSACCINNPGVHMPNSNLKEMVNNESLKKLRLDMLAGQKNDTCENCYRTESERNSRSARQSVNENYTQYFEEVYKTQSDGSIKDFKMRYMDVRFSNLCNMKCRSCSSQFSSKWEAEEKAHNIPIKFANRIDLLDMSSQSHNSKTLLQDCIEQIPYLETIYFAGGEPLLTEEHYILLKEIIKQKRTDIKLIYNSNASILTFKNDNVLKLWEKFDSPIDFAASIDHYGSRAEYIRHGVSWSVIRNNLRQLEEHHKVRLGFTTVVSVYNYLTLDKLIFKIFNELISKEHQGKLGFINLTMPEYLSAQILPKNLKEKARHRLTAACKYLQQNDFYGQIGELRSLMDWVELEDKWEQQSDNFVEYTQMLDKIRDEDFEKTFPELSELVK